MKRLALTALAMALLFSVSADGARDEVTFEGLLNEMVTLDHLARQYPDGTRLVQFSSYDRTSKVEDGDTIGWWANFDLGQYLRGETTDRGVEYVMAEATGPGVLTRMWSANPGNRTWRVYIDDMDTPALEYRGKNLLGGKVEPWGPAFADRRNMGGNFYFPLPFSRGCKVTVAYNNGKQGSRPPLMYYHVDLRLYPEGVTVEPFSMELLDKHAARIEEIASVLADPSSMPEPEGDGQSVELELAPGAEGPLFMLDGPAAVRLLRVEVKAKDEVLPELLGRTLLTIKWDGEESPSVAVPLGDFFGASPGVADLNSLPAVMSPTDKGALLESRWVMPFNDSAEITLSNMSNKRLHLTATIITSPWQWDDDSLYMNVSWREKNDIPTRPENDMRMLLARGKGHFVGLQQNVRNPMNYFWWGEGDEKVWVDDDEFPGIFGTGTEDYFGYAWCVQYFHFSHAYHGVPLPTDEWLAVAQASPMPFVWEAASKMKKKPAVVSQYRWHIIDAVPFDQRIRFDMEILHHRKTEVDVNATTYWYATAETTNDAEVPDLSAREVWDY